MKLERWGWYSIGVNIFLMVSHGFIAAASGSLAVAAELVHNVVDLLMAAAVLIGPSWQPVSRGRFPMASTRRRTWWRRGSRA